MSIMPNYIITSNSSPDQFTLFDCRTCINPIWIDENVISKTWYRYNVNINQFSVSLHRKMVCLYFDCTCKRITSMMRALCSVCALVSVSVWYCLKISIFITSIVWFASFVILNLVWRLEMSLFGEKSISVNWIPWRSTYGKSFDMVYESYNNWEGEMRVNTIECNPKSCGSSTTTQTNDKQDSGREGKCGMAFQRNFMVFCRWNVISHTGSKFHQIWRWTQWKCYEINKFDDIWYGYTRFNQVDIQKTHIISNQ